MAVYHCKLYEHELIWSFASLHNKGLLFSYSGMHRKAQYVSFVNTDIIVIFGVLWTTFIDLPVCIWTCRCCHVFLSAMFRFLLFACHFLHHVVKSLKVFCFYFLFIWLRRVQLSCSVGKQKWASLKMNGL